MYCTRVHLATPMPAIALTGALQAQVTGYITRKAGQLRVSRVMEAVQCTLVVDFPTAGIHATRQSSPGLF